MLRAVVVGLAALLLAPAGAHAAAAGSVTHSDGVVSATLAWDASADAGDLGIDNPRLFVVRSGTRYDLTIADICDAGCVLTEDRKDFPSILKVADLDGDGEPEILVDTYSGGAHCCLTARVLTWDGTGYQAHDVQWGDVTYTLEDADGNGTQELVGSDTRFAYTFTAYAGSGFPVLVYNLVAGAPVDTTKNYPKLIAHDAFHWLHAMRAIGRHGDTRGPLSAYAADEYLLGKGSVASREIAHQRKQHHISKSFGPFLLRKLRAWGYRGAAKAAAASISVPGSILIGHASEGEKTGTLLMGGNAQGRAPFRTTQADLGIDTPPIEGPDGEITDGDEGVSAEVTLAERPSRSAYVYAMPVSCTLQAIVGSANRGTARVALRFANGRTKTLRLRRAPRGWHYAGHMIAAFVHTTSRVIGVRAYDAHGRVLPGAQWQPDPACG